jgi:hypothetical protein
VPAINFEDYLISFEIRFQRNLRRSANRAIVRMRQMPHKMRKAFEKITVPTLEGGGGPITFRTKLTMPKAQWEIMAKETERLRDDLFSDGNRQSLFAQKVGLAVDNMLDNVVGRFSVAAIEDVTGQLRGALENQSVLVEEYVTRGIRAATMNIGQLNAGTIPYWVDKKTGKVTFGRAMSKQYSYTLPGGTKVPVSGYWAFLEFGTSRGLAARSFIRDISMAAHAEDDAEKAKVENWLRSRVEEYNAKAREIMS